MTYQNGHIAAFDECDDPSMVHKRRSEDPYIVGLIKVLRQHPAGLRRWSVMRAMRRRWDDSGRETTQKFEDEVERAFRRMCVDTDLVKNRECTDATALFFRPEERAGEVWAVHLDRAATWLEAKHMGSD
jgi:hypothetical protein